MRGSQASENLAEARWRVLWGDDTRSGDESYVVKYEVHADAEPEGEVS